MRTNRARIAFIGSGGDGVMSVAAMVMKASAEHGLYGLMAQSYGPQIRGGEAAAYLHVSSEKVYTENYEKDIVICYNFAHLDRFNGEFGFYHHCVLFYEEEDKTPVPEWIRDSVKHLHPIPFKKNLKSASLPLLSKNVYSFGILSRIFDWDLKKTTKFVEQAFLKKGPEVVNTNIKAFQMGYMYGESIKLPFECILKDGDKTFRSITGNIAAAEASIKAGCRFFAGYPITPSSEVMEAFLRDLPKKNGKVIQAEDEIASLGMVLGASYGGVLAMTATSGPGLSLMTEMIGLASMVETPAVILNVQRGGPSTGIPSKTEQSDLYHSVYGGHGDFPRVVLAITDVQDSFAGMYRAFYLSEKYHLPVIVLSDGYIGQRAENIPKKIDTSSFPRPTRLKVEGMPQGGEKLNDLYPDIPEGVEPTLEPGTLAAEGISHHVAGIEQDICGKPSASRVVHERMSHRRLLKMESIRKETSDWYEIIGNPKSKHAFVCWGSTKGTMAQILEHNPDIKVFVPHIIEPFPKEALEDFIKGVSKLAFVELNFQGQLHQHVKTCVDLPKDTIVMKLGGGSPLSPFELKQKLKETPFGEVIQ
jgi:2-oxoglutarate/2-oxoacid ferredoxin oxidoreductase subunit alpha